MRVLFVNRMASMARGGGETFDLEISRHLQKLGCEISFLSGIPMFGKARMPIPHLRSHLLRTPYTGGWFPWDRVKGGWRLRLADFWCFERRACAWAGARAGQFDVIQVCELPFFVAEWKRRRYPTPVVMRLTAPNYWNWRGAVQKADAIIASGVTVEKVRASDRPDCVDVPNAVDTDVFRPHHSGFRERVGIEADEMVVLYVARFQDFKNHRLLIEAFKRFLTTHPRSRLVLVGSGHLERSTRARCRALGMAAKVLFLGEVPFDQLPDIYAAADIKVIASDFESFCFAALEAMATGLPIVTTDCGWVPRLIERDQGGAVVPVNDAVPLAGALARFANGPDLRRRAGAHNRQRALERHGWAPSAEALLGVYRNLKSSS